MIRFSIPATVFVVLVSLLGAACNRDLSTAQGVAEEFVDRHYVAMDLQRSKDLTVSIALEKVNEQIRLIGSHKIDASTHKPRVSYKLIEKKESDRRSSYLFQGTIHSDNSTSFTRHWLVTARKEGDQWRVSNFTESD